MRRKQITEKMYYDQYGYFQSLGFDDEQCDTLQWFLSDDVEQLQWSMTLTKSELELQYQRCNILHPRAQQ